MSELTAEEAEAAEWSGRRGDHISRRWTRTSGGTAYQAGSLLVQIRSGPNEDDPLVASSVSDDQSDTVALITTTGTDLTADDPVVAWQITAAEYLKLPAGGQYWIGGEVLTAAGRPREIFRRRWRVTPQTAVRSAG